MILIILLGWVAFAPLSMLLIAFINVNSVNNKNKSLSKEIEELSEGKDALPGAIFAMLSGPLMFIILFWLYIWLKLPKIHINISRILFYIPLKLAQLIDWFSTKPERPL